MKINESNQLDYDFFYRNDDGTEFVTIQNMCK